MAEDIKRSILSVIVPVYNVEEYLHQCIDSIRNQNLKQVEIILVNDGSTDASGKICEDYAADDSRISVIHKKNQGMLAARYTGVLAATGQYLSFVDADDWIDKETYSLFLRQMRAGIDIIIFGKTVDTENSGTASPFFLYEEGYYDEKRIRSEIWGNALWDEKYKRSGIPHSLCDKIFKRDLLLRSYDLIKEKRYINMGEDAMILFPMLQWTESAYISHQCPYHYRKHLTKTPPYVSEDSYFRNLFNWYEYLDEHTREITGIKKQLDYIYMNLMKGRREYYGDYVRDDEYLFPFDRVPAKSQIILYGAGRVGSTYYAQLRRVHYVDLVRWVDKNYEKYKYKELGDPEGIEQLPFDYIVIAVESDTIDEEIRRWLYSKGIDRNKIVSSNRH